MQKNNTPVQNVLCDFLKVKEGQEKSKNHTPTINQHTTKKSPLQPLLFRQQNQVYNNNNNYNNIYLDINKVYLERTGKNGRKIKGVVPKVERHYKQKDNKKGTVYDRFIKIQM